MSTEFPSTVLKDEGNVWGSSRETQETHVGSAKNRGSQVRASDRTTSARNFRSLAGSDQSWDGRESVVSIVDK